MEMTPYQRWLATRSAIPKVIGILGIIFACLGVATSAIWTWGSLDDLTHWDRDGVWTGVETWLRVWGFASCALFAIHLTAALFALGYRPMAPRLVTVYSVVALTLIVIDVVLEIVLAPTDSNYYYRSIRDSTTIMHIVYSGLAMPWPIVALILMTRKPAKAACIKVPATA
jgi:hypothetical protein